MPLESRLKNVLVVVVVIASGGVVPASAATNAAVHSQDGVPVADLVSIDGGDVRIRSSEADDRAVLRADGAGGQRLDIAGRSLQISAARSLTLDTLDGDDTLVVDLSGGLDAVPPGGLVFNGGGDRSVGDLIVLTGAPASAPLDDVTYTPEPPDARGHRGVLSLTRGGQTRSIRFSGLEPIVDLNVVVNMFVNLTPAGETINLVEGAESPANDPVTGSPETMYEINFAGAFEQFSFRNKQNVTIRGFDGGDTFTMDVPNQLGDSLAAVVLDGDDGAGGADVADSFTIANHPAGVSVTVNGGNPTTSPGDGLVYTAGGATVTGAGDGTLTPDDVSLPAISYTSIETLQPGWAIGDRAWHDLDGDGLQDAGEPGLQGVTVELLSCGTTTVVAITITDASGFYQFTNLEIDTSYRVRFTPPMGYFLSPANAGMVDDVDSDADPATGITPCAGSGGVLGLVDDSLDAGMYQAASLGGRVWEDLDADGLQDAGEPGLPAVTVQLLDCSFSVLATTTTDASGGYTFSNLQPGSWVVEVVPPAGRAFSQADVGADDSLDSDVAQATGRTPCLTLVSGESRTNVDAGLAELAEIGDRVWEDLDADGLQDAGEPGVPGVTVRLLDCAFSVLAATTTDASGGYTFVGLQAGSYVIEVVPPGGYVVTAVDQGADDTIDSDIAPASGRSGCLSLALAEVNDTVDAGLFVPAAITATKEVSGQTWAGGTVVYTITLVNGGGIAIPDLAGPEFSDTLPTELVPVGVAIVSGGGTAGLASGVVTWNGSIPVGGTVVLEVSATVAETVPTGAVVSNQGTVTYDGDGDGAAESTVQTDDPATASEDDPTAFTTAPVPGIPAAGPAGLLVLAVLLAGVGVLLLRRGLG